MQNKTTDNKAKFNNSQANANILNNYETLRIKDLYYKEYRVRWKLLLSVNIIFLY